MTTIPDPQRRIHDLLREAAALWVAVNGDERLPTTSNGFVRDAEAAYYEALPPVDRPTLPPWQPRGEVVELADRDGWFCAYCGRGLACCQGDLDGGEPLPTVDHIVPRALGGSEEFSNKCLACAKCNSTKGARSAEEFRQANGYYR